MHDFVFIVKEMKYLFEQEKKLLLKLKATAFVRLITAE